MFERSADMKIAHLILAHKNPRQLELLISALRHPQFDIYVHIDAKTDAKPFTYLFDEPSVFAVQNRTKIYWAGYGTIQATINGFREILPGNYDYINVISAQDYPLRPAVYIYDYLCNRAGREFITCQSIDDEWKEAAGRVKQYHLINWRIPGKHRLEKFINKIAGPRKFPLDYKIVGKANWFTLSREASQYIIDFIDSHPEIVRYFQYCWGADEFMFSTILYNSPFKEKIVDNLVYVDWPANHHGHPRVLTMEDESKLKNSDKLFARKFDMDKCSGILHVLQEWISRNQLTI